MIINNIQIFKGNSLINIWKNNILKSSKALKPKKFKINAFYIYNFTIS